MPALAELKHIVSALAFPPLKQVMRSPDATGESRVRHCPANLNVSASIGEVKHVAPDFDFRNIFAEVYRPTHAQFSRIDGAEREQNATAEANGKVGWLTGRRP